MSAKFIGTGNVGNMPELRYVSANGDDRPVCEFRCCFDRLKRNEDGSYEKLDELWATVNVWNQRGERAAKLINKGARVKVEGRLRLASWEDKETGEERSAIKIDADDVTLDLSRIESVTYKSKAATSDANGTD